MLFVFGFAASAFAIHADIPSDTTATVAGGATQITLSGEIRVRYDYQHASASYGNFVDNQPDRSYADERMRLGVEAKLSPNTTGMIQFDTWGGSTSATATQDVVLAGTGGLTTTTGTPQSGATGTYRAGNDLKSIISLRQLWILNTGTGLLGVTSGIKVGHMPLLLGNGLFYDHSYYGDDALVLFTYPIKELELDAVAIKFREATGATSSFQGLSNQSNAYAFVANYKPSKDTGISFDVTYVDDQNSEAGLTGYTAGALMPDTHLWNFGLRGNTTVEGFRLKIDGEVQTGEVSNNAVAIPSVWTAKSNVDFGGYALQAGVGYTLDPVKLDLEFGYGSGDKGSSSNKIDTFITAQGPESTFGDPYRSAGVSGPYVYNYRTVNATDNLYGGLANTWYLRLGGNADLTKDWNLDMAIFYLQAVDTINPNNAAIYNALAGSPASGALNAATSFRTTSGTGSNHDIGTELDARLCYQIDKGLKAWVEGGYLWAGDFWKAMSSVPAGTSPTNVYTIREGIQLNF